MKPYGLGLYEKALPDALTWEQKLMETHICGFDWKTHPQFRSQAATRLREVGIASNRGSAYREMCIRDSLLMTRLGKVPGIVKSDVVYINT